MVSEILRYKNTKLLLLNCKDLLFQAPDFFYLNEEVLAAMKEAEAKNAEARAGKSVTSLDSLRQRFNN